MFDQRQAAGGQMKSFFPGCGLRRYGAVLLGVFAALFLLAGCGYHFAGYHENRIAVGKTIWVSFINNETTNSTAQTVLRRALLDQYHQLRGVSPASDKDSAEFSVKGDLRSYSVYDVSYTAIDHVKEYRLTINVELELLRKGEAAPLWKGTLQASQSYPVSSDLSLQRDAEEAALAAASRIIAQRFVTAVEQSY